MAKWKCNNCGTVYDDMDGRGMELYHACKRETVEEASAKAGGATVPAGDRPGASDFRDERPAPGYSYVNGKLFTYGRDPESLAAIPVPASTHPIVSEGKGRTKIE